jgi:hypothetical protein
MTYTINTTTLYNDVDAEVSRISDAAYSDNGTSLYDAVVLTEKDEDWVEDLIGEAVQALLRPLADIATLSSTTITIDAPDIVTANATAASDAITRYLVLSATMGVLQERRAALVPVFATRVQEALNDVISLVRTRIAPSRS